jgi:hypothetical protein
MAPEQKYIGVKDEWNIVFFRDVTVCVIAEA